LIEPKNACLSRTGLAWQFAIVPGRKIGPAFAKERRASSSILESASPGENMNNGNHAKGVEPVRIWKARNFIEQHSGEELSLGRVAQAANTSPNYFSEKFKEATGITFVRYVARARFGKAAMLLAQSNLRVSEIAFAVGFQSLSQFNRTFKTFAGKSPTAYRAAARHRNGNGSEA
jgi:transcriptional regulator GlxA family with amidase domain